MRINTAIEVGLLVRDRRRQLVMSQEALAERVGSSRQSVWMLATGKQRLELGLTLRALSALGFGIEANLPTDESGVNR